MDVPGQNHRDPWFAELYKSILEDTKFIYQTKEGTPFIFPGTGTGGWEVRVFLEGTYHRMRVHSPQLLPT
jgi:aspartate aminotransferase-like enzyme